MIMVVDPGVQAVYGKKLEDSNDSERKKQTKRMPDHPGPGPT
jgi:hypothetical protein